MSGVHKGTVVRGESDCPLGALHITDCHDTVIYALAPLQVGGGVGSIWCCPGGGGEGSPGGGEEEEGGGGCRAWWVDSEHRCEVGRQLPARQMVQ